MQSQVKFNRIPEEVVWEAVVQCQVRFNRVPEKVTEKVPEKVPGSGSIGFRSRFRRRSGRLGLQSQVRFHRVPEKVPEKVLGIFGAGSGQVPTGSTGFGFAAPFTKICKNSTSRLLGIPPKLIFSQISPWTNATGITCSSCQKFLFSSCGALSFFQDARGSGGQRAAVTTPSRFL